MYPDLRFVDRNAILENVVVVVMMGGDVGNVAPWSTRLLMG